MRISDTSDLWWKNAVIYCLDIETYFDANDDGIGDFAGLAERIDYLAELGITCLWLMPFYPTPDRDDGYDVMDLYSVDSRLGTHGDLVEVIRTANDRGIRVIADLVINHTSNRHPWFVSARRSPNSPYRDFYVWRTDPPPDTSAQVVFPDKEEGIWSWDEQAGAWYLHHFYSHQPDLNFANPRVREEIAKTMGFWLQVGLEGFRVDAVPFLVQDVETSDPTTGVPADPHQYLRELRAFANRRRGTAILLGEVNLPHRDQAKYFGGTRGDELNMMFDFIGMQNLYLSLARGDARPLAKALASRPKVSPDNQWATFLRNTTSSPSTSSRSPSGRRCSTRSGPSRSCRSTGGGSSAGCRRCWTGTPAGCGWLTACCSRCRAPPACTTARRSGWARTSPRRAGWPCARRCSGLRARTGASRRRHPGDWCRRSWRAASAPST